MDLPFLILTVLLVAVGVIMMFSASYARAYFKTGNSTTYFARQGGFAVAGIGIMWLISRINYQIWRSLSVPIMAGSIFLLLLVPFVGEEEGGAVRWIVLFGINFQPSEIAKLAVVLCFSAMISVFKDRMRTFRYGVAPFVAILGVIAGLLFLEPHLSATIIILATGAALMFLGGTRGRWFALGIGAAVLVVVLYLNFQGYASDRITAWRDPFSDPSDNGYQILQSLYAIGSGGLMGLGFGKGRQKYLYLPEEHNDYIFSIVCEELGFVGAALIILMFVLLIVRGYWIAMHARDRFGMLVTAGLTTLLLMQVFLNIGVVTNFLPATGISLPFFSYGGTALLIQLVEMGIILNVSRSNKQNMI
ncbi:MAG: putative lipid II flippase FtsW [Oscillospiraceae bacterium]|nr:putative lipid II flippase FtsW [Oscillospiraceae bacterium]